MSDIENKILQDKKLAIRLYNRRRYLKKIKGDIKNFSKNNNEIDIIILNFLNIKKECKESDLFTQDI